MLRKELAECGMLLRVGVVIDQRGLVSELLRDVRVLAREGVPGRQLLRVDIAAVGSLEYGRRVSTDDGAESLSVLRECRSSERDGKCNGDKQR